IAATNAGPSRYQLVLSEAWVPCANLSTLDPYHPNKKVRLAENSVAANRGAHARCFVPGRGSPGDVEPTTGDQRQAEGRPDTRRGGHHRGDRVDDPHRGGYQSGVIVIAETAAQADVHGVRRLAGDLDAVGTAGLGRLRPIGA